ncbi:MAG: ABC transporter substrate-binding protein [Gemmatimonadetes bacterium]|nr:ABC transporter substrate-binding protein [Gemmatimonadota bacterium]
MKSFTMVAALACAVCAPAIADAEQSAKAAKIGLLCPLSCRGVSVDVFRETLRALGYAEGQNIVFEYRAAEGRIDRLAALAAELVSAKVDVIFTPWGTAAAQAAKRATATIPIVVAAAGDPVATGIVASLPRPGANVTGSSSLALDLEGKRLELLRQLLPRVSRVAVLWDPGNPYSALAVKQEEVTAQTLGIKLQRLLLRDVADLDAASAAMARERAEAISVHAYIPVLRDTRRIVELAARQRVPAVYPLREFVDEGGLMSYGANLADIARRAAAYVDKILKGARPADLPVEQPTRFELVINLKTAKALGITIPQSLLLRADQVIQ